MSTTNGPTTRTSLKAPVRASWMERAMSEGTNARDGLAPSERPGLPYNLILALTVVALASMVFVVVLYMFRDTFTDGALVTTALSTLFGIFGTVVGAFFGIKSSSEAHDKSREEVARANDAAKRALAMLPPNEGRKVMGLEP